MIDSTFPTIEANKGSGNTIWNTNCSGDISILVAEWGIVQSMTVQLT